MFDEPEERQSESAADPAMRAKEKIAEMRMHAELAAIFEGPRKFDADLIPTLDAGAAREIQQAIAKLDKAKKPGMPVLPPDVLPQATALLARAGAGDPSTNDYHIHRRPGEVMMVRLLEGEQVESFYQRLQAHFDAAMEGIREDERQALQWKQDEKIEAYLKALDDVKFTMAEYYLRDPIRKLGAAVLSTWTADDMNIAFLAEHLMDRTIEDVVGSASAPDDPTDESQLGWFFKLFSLRGFVEGKERIVVFAYLQKTDDSYDF